jgi:carbon-monoxide dehydrogenase small subunit
MNVTLTLNGSGTTLDVPGTMRLLDLLRDVCGLTGTKEGCGKGECGACSVLLDGQLVNACLVLACQVHGRDVVTIEGLAQTGVLDDVQQAFVDTGAVQCGFCIPGMVLAAEALLRKHPEPRDADIRRGLSGNLCRCTGYSKIVDAVKLAAQRRRTAGETS